MLIRIHDDMQHPAAGCWMDQPGHGNVGSAAYPLDVLADEVATLHDALHHANNHACPGVEVGAQSPGALSCLLGSRSF